jgi:hypothetical protein
MIKIMKSHEYGAVRAAFGDKWVGLFHRGNRTWRQLFWRVFWIRKRKGNP